MKAVNLIPAELRKGDSSGGHSGGVVYIVLGALAVLVVLMAAWAGMGKQINDRRAEAARLKVEADAIEARAAKLAHFEKAAADSRTRVEKVRELAVGRFEWAHTLREVSRVLPADTWLTGVTGTLGPNITVEGGQTNPLRGSDQGPALEIVGCTTKQDQVARLMARLRAMDAVTRVALAKSEKLEVTGGGGGGTGSGGGATSDDCRGGNAKRPKFEVVVFFRPMPGQTTGRPADGAAPGAQTQNNAANGASGSSSSTPPAGGTASPSTASGGAQ